MKFGFIEKLGGYKGALEALKAAGYTIKDEQAIRVWETRKSIPPGAQLKLMSIAGKRGIPLGDEDFEYKEKK